ncbi:DUF1771-domain-containing protein [Abortiporus biennis]|nr:DUF1771-domain-containing protein [Abortiporus biennis]
MGLFDAILRGLVHLICGSSQPQTSEIVSPKPEYAYPPKQQQPAYHERPRPSQQEQVNRPPTHKPKPKPKPSHKAPSPGPGRLDQNQINQHNEEYMALRAKANEEGDEMSRCFEEAHQAYSSGDGAKAKELSNEGKRHQAEMERLNRKASEWIYIENNKDSNPGEIDLHGLYVKEALSFTERAIEDARRRGDSEVHLIVGKGLHSNGGRAKIRPAIEELMQKERLIAEIDPNNAGVLIVSLDGHDRGIGRVIRSDDLARGIESKDESCIIM